MLDDAPHERSGDDNACVACDPRRPLALTPCAFLALLESTDSTHLTSDDLRARLKEIARDDERAHAPLEGGTAPVDASDGPQECRPETQAAENEAAARRGASCVLHMICEVETALMHMRAGGGTVAQHAKGAGNVVDADDCAEPATQLRRRSIARLLRLVVHEAIGAMRRAALGPSGLRMPMAPLEPDAPGVEAIVRGADEKESRRAAAVVEAERVRGAIDALWADSAVVPLRFPGDSCSATPSGSLEGLLDKLRQSELAALIADAFEPGHFPAWAMEHLQRWRQQAATEGEGEGEGSNDGDTERCGGCWVEYDSAAFLRDVQRIRDAMYAHGGDASQAAAAEHAHSRVQRLLGSANGEAPVRAPADDAACSGDRQVGGVQAGELASIFPASFAAPPAAAASSSVSAGRGSRLSLRGLHLRAPPAATTTTFTSSSAADAATTGDPPTTRLRLLPKATLPPSAPSGAPTRLSLFRAQPTPSGDGSGGGGGGGDGDGAARARRGRAAAGAVVRKPRTGLQPAAKRKQKGAEEEGAEEGEGKGGRETVHWIQCDACDKWRIVPRPIGADVARWECGDGGFTCVQRRAAGSAAGSAAKKEMSSAAKKEMSSAAKKEMSRSDIAAGLHRGRAGALRVSPSTPRDDDVRSLSGSELGRIFGGRSAAPSQPPPLGLQDGVITVPAAELHELKQQVQLLRTELLERAAPPPSAPAATRRKAVRTRHEKRQRGAEGEEGAPRRGPVPRSARGDRRQKRPRSVASSSASSSSRSSSSASSASSSSSSSRASVASAAAASRRPAARKAVPRSSAKSRAHAKGPPAAPAPPQPMPPPATGTTADAVPLELAQLRAALGQQRALFDRLRHTALGPAAAVTGNPAMEAVVHELVALRERLLALRRSC